MKYLPAMVILMAAPSALAEEYESQMVPPVPLLAESLVETPVGDKDALSFHITAEVRLREEVYEGLFRPASPDGLTDFDLSYLRNRAAIAIARGDLSAIIEVQDARALGEAGTTEDSEGLDLRRGALKIDGIFDTDTWLEAGRLALAYGDQRLIGSLEWVNQGRTFDGGRLRIGSEAISKGSWTDVFALVTRETREAYDDQYLSGVYTHYVSGPWTSEAYGMLLVDRLDRAGEMGTGKSTYATLGTRQVYKNAGMDASLEAAAQYGEVHGDDLLAYGVALRARYTFEDMAVKPTGGIEFAMGSGDKDGSDGDADTFQYLFPTNHMHYGIADEASWSNIVDVRATAGITPHARFTMVADYHHLRLADAAGGWFDATGQLVRAGNDSAAAHLGDEIDLVLRYAWREGLNIESGYALFLPGAFVDDTGGGETAHFAYLQLSAALQ